jgi:hypothetical protein
MGFFSKIWKGVKKGFKNLFMPIKSVFKAFGKFMNKIGIVGQIAMMFIPIPGLGALMSSMGSALGGAATALGASGNIIAQGAGKLLSGALKVGTKIGQGFKTITEGVKTFVGNTGKYLANKIPGVNIAGAPKSFFGPGSESVLGRTSASISKNMDILFGKTPVDPFATKVKPIESKEVFNQGATDNVYEGYKSEGMPATPGTDFKLPDSGIGVEGGVQKPYEFQASGGSSIPTKDTLNISSPVSVEAEGLQMYQDSTGKVVSGRSNVLDNLQAKTDFGPTMSGSPKQSILGRIGTGIMEAPGKVSDFVTNTGEGGLLDYSYKKAAAVPGQMIDQGIRGLIAGKPDAQEQYSQGYAPIQTDSYAASQLAGSMRSLDVYSQFGGFTDYMTPIMSTGTSDKGLWAMNLQQRTG